MSGSDVTPDDVCLWGGACARCGQPVLDIARGVIQRRALYHSACWLQLMSAASSTERGIAKDADGAR